MHHFVVDAGADAGRETVITLETGGRPHLSNTFFGISIDIPCGLTGLHHPHHFPKHSGDNVAGLAHDLHLARRLDLNTATLLNPRARCCHLPLGGLGGCQKISKEIHGSAQYPSRYQQQPN